MTTPATPASPFRPSPTDPLHLEALAAAAIFARALAAYRTGELRRQNVAAQWARMAQRRAKS